MKVSEKVAIARIFADLIKADRVVDTAEMECWRNICRKSSIDRDVRNGAIRIVNGSITPSYIQYLWVRQQSDLSNKTVRYVPTETNLPILESTRALLPHQE